MNLFKQFQALIPGADPLLVGTVTATTGTGTTLETPRSTNRPEAT